MKFFHASMRAAALRIAAAAALALFLLPAMRASADVAIQSGQKLAFLGDSITAFGWGKPAGYVRLVVAGLAANGVNVTPIPAGVSGNTSRDMLARLQRDVINKKPDWMTLSCGVNDVWHGANGVTLDEYEKNIASIVSQCQDAGIKVMILTSTPIGEDLNNANNVKLADYNAYLRDLARQKGCPLADLNAAFAAVYAKKTAKGNAYTVDGVHMNPAGDFIMATGILRAFGVSDAGLQTAADRWMDIAGGVPLQINITPRQWFALQQQAASQGSDASAVASKIVSDSLANQPAK